ncbi:MAG: bile acid:sodium symporter family protein [Thermogutta sp.]
MTASGQRRVDIIRWILERYLPGWLVLLCTVAFFWPTLNQGPYDPFVAGKGYLKYFIAVTMFFIGSLLPREELLTVFRRWPLVLFGTTVQYCSMPALAYLFGRAMGLEGPFLIGVLIVGCVPGAMASNVLTLVARGNVSYSVSLTTSATLLSPLVVPFVMWLTVGQFAQFPVVGTGIELFLMVVFPVGLGYTLSQVSAKWREICRWLGPITANLVILWIIAVVVAVNRDTLRQLTGPLVGALAGVNLGGYLAGFAAGWAIRLPVSMRRALTLEIGMQNAGLGTTLALILFPSQPQVAVPCALYTFGCMFTGTLLARAMAARRPPQDPHLPADPA